MRSVIHFSASGPTEQDLKHTMKESGSNRQNNKNRTGARSTLCQFSPSTGHTDDTEKV